MKHAVIVSHPNPDSFTMAVARTYCAAVQALGHEAQLRDLYRMGFDPCLKADEIPSPKGFAARPDVQTERALVGDAEVFVFVYPLWFNAPPAMLKGYIDRVLTMGFGYGPVAGGGNQPLLIGRKMISFTSSGAPADWLQKEGGWAAIRALFDGHVANVCGLAVLDHIHFGDVSPILPKVFVEQNLHQVEAVVGRLFSPVPVDQAQGVDSALS
jgi:NAD(P)H dehydrogenase (quinone)